VTKSQVPNEDRLWLDRQSKCVEQSNSRMEEKGDLHIGVSIALRVITELLQRQPLDMGKMGR